MRGKHIDPVEIRRLYVDDGRSAADVAALLGCSESNIKQRLERMGVERRPMGRPKPPPKPPPPKPTPGQCRICGRPTGRKDYARCKICIAIEGLERG